MPTWKEYMNQQNKYAQQFPQYIGNMVEDDSYARAKKEKEERRSRCPKCGCTDLKWEAWGSYLDKDLVCIQCNYVVDIWDC